MKDNKYSETEMANCNYCDNAYCKKLILASQIVVVSLGVPQVPVSIHTCSPRCAQTLIQQAYESDAFHHEREHLTEEACRIGATLEDTSDISGASDSDEANTPPESIAASIDVNDDDDEFGLRKGLPQNIATSQQLIAASSAGGVTGSIKRLFGSDRGTAVDTNDILKNLMKRIDAYGEQIYDRQEELRADNVEVGRVMNEYLVSRGVTGSLLQNYVTPFTREWVNAIQKTLASPGWLVDPKYAAKAKDRQEFLSKRTRHNSELGVLLAKFALNTYSPDPMKQVNWPFLMAGVWEIVNEVRKKRSTNGIRLLETLLIISGPVDVNPQN